MINFFTTAYKIILITSAILIFQQSSFAQSSVDSLDRKLNKILEIGHLPGFVVAVVSPNGTHFQKGYGYRDVDRNLPFNTQTVMNIGSVPKTMTGIALAQLVEKGKIKWDTPINDILPFRIYNPKHRKEPITIKHLATHTSSIYDSDDYERTYLFKEKLQLPIADYPEDIGDYIGLYNGNKEMHIHDFLKEILHPLGKWYSKKNYLNKKPGHKYMYSNLGALIAGYIIEIVTGESYQEYVQNHILTPLKMKNSGWSWDQVNPNNQITHYLGNDISIPKYDLVAYGDGGLITNIDDLSNYFSTMLKGYDSGENPLLASESIQKIMGVAFESKKRKSGLFWTINGRNEIGHSGGDPGIMAFMMFNPKTKIGRIIMTNKSDDDGNEYNQLVYIWKTLEDYMTKIAKEDRKPLND